MELKIKNIRVDAQTIEPSLIIDIDLGYYQTIDAPISFSGRLISGDKVVSFINEYKINQERAFELYVQTRPARDEMKRRNAMSYPVQLTAYLSAKSIEHIETVRENDREKNVKFDLAIIVKYIEIHAETQITANSLISVNIKELNSYFEIKHSDWVNKYAPNLGLGNFLLLELQIPDEKKVSEFWEQLYSKLTRNLKDMEAALRSGDWPKTMLFARKFYENIKIGDKKPAHKKFKDELRLLLIKDQHSEEGIKNFLDGIWNFFDFISKYMHDKDTEGNIKSSPIATKEDAYFAYALGIGLLNVIGKKISKE